MTRGLFLIAFFMAGSSAPVLGADDRPYPPPVLSWTGLYLGGQIGYLSGTETNSLNPSSNAPSGFIGGGHFGYNVQFPSSNIMLGFEADAEGTTARSTVSYPAATSGGVTGYYNTGIIASIRGRLGYAAGRALFYGTGGVAYAGIRNNYFDTFGDEDSSQRTLSGFTVGGGVEYAIDKTWSVRAEYRYTNFGPYADQLSTTTATGATNTKHETNNRFEIGFSYKIDSLWTRPVSAAY